MLVLETHHYDGGVKVNTFPAQQSVQVPLPSSVAILNAESPLGPKEVACKVHFSWLTSEILLVWVGLYIRSIDRQFGDRENYVSVGLWLPNLVLLGSAEFLQLMLDGAQRLHNEGMTESLREAFERLAKIAESFVHPRSSLPSICQGTARQGGSLSERVQFKVGPSISELAPILDCGLMNLQLAPDPFVTVEEAVFFAGEGVEKRGGLELLPSREELLLPLVVALPGMAEETAKELTSTRRDLADAVKRRDECNKEVTKTASQLAELKAAHEALRRIELEQREEIKRLRELPYVIIDVSLRNIAQRLDRLEIRGDGPQPKQPASPPRRPSGSRPIEVDPINKLLKWIGIGIGLLALSGIGYFAVISLKGAI